MADFVQFNWIILFVDVTAAVHAHVHVVLFADVPDAVHVVKS